MIQHESSGGVAVQLVKDMIIMMNKIVSQVRFNVITDCKFKFLVRVPHL